MKRYKVIEDFSLQTKDCDINLETDSTILKETLDKIPLDLLKYLIDKKIIVEIELKNNFNFDLKSLENNCCAYCEHRNLNGKEPPLY